MPRWTQTWLSGLGAAGAARDPGGWPGKRLGLPPGGPGAVAGTAPRIAAFAIDSLGSGFVAALFIQDAYDSRRGLLGVAILALEYIVLVTLTGQTLGMRLLRLRVAPRDGARTPALVPVALRTALLLLLIPALITDRDRRGLHDLASRTVVVAAGARGG